MIECCATCRYRVLSSRAVYDRDLGANVERSRQECRFAPPRAGQGWPTVYLNNWCGDFAPVPHKAEPDEPAHWLAERARGVTE